MAPTAIRKTSRSRLQDIILLLQDKGESLAACRSRLSLTCKEIEDICCFLYSSSLLSDSVISLLDNVKAIRILPEPASSSASESTPINLSPFHKVTHLEVRNVSISRVINLSQLRSQLVQLVLHVSTDTLDQVLRECGGDKCTDSFLWSELHSLHITSYRSLDLGTGLFLAPWLKTLDLTFNELTDNSLQSLSSLLTLHTLVLNCNSLQRIPVLAPSARTSLKVLHLRQNQLDSLNGIEQLHSIEELDVAYNCISNGEAVSSLSFLTHLVKLNIEFNPLTYIKDYRLVVLRRVPASVNRKKFLLDDKPLNAIDKENVGTMASLYVNPPAITVRGDESHATPTTNNGINAAPSPGLLNAASCDSFSTTSITPAASSSSLSAVKRRKASRMREVEIADQPVVRFPEENEEVAEPLVTEPIGDDLGHLQTKQQVEELRRVFGQENWLTSQAGNQVRLLLGWQDGGTSETVEPRQDKEDAIVVLESEMEPFIGQLNESKEEEEEEETDHLFVFVVQRQMNNSETLDERLLAVSTQYLYEKDVLTGATLVRWKRSGLQRVNLLDKEHSVVKVQLSFNPPTNEPIYYVMDQEDFEEVEKLVVSDEITDSSSIVINDVTRSRVDMSCMKCDQKFPSVQAAVRLRTVVSSPLLKGQLEEYSVCPYCASDMVFAIDRQPNVDSSESSMSSSSSSSGSDVVVATNDPYSPGRSSGLRLDKSSDEDSVKVMDKTSRLANFTPNVEIIKSAAKSLSSRSHGSSKSSSRSNRSTTSKLQSSTSLFTYSYADFSQVDHRLRLYCEMFLLSHHAEEFHGLIKAELVTNNAGPTDEEMLPYPALLVVTSHKIYFLRITASYSEQPEKWLNLESSFPLGQLVNIMSVIGQQGLVLKFSNATTHLVLLRDQRRTRNVILFLTDVYEKSGLTVPALRTDLMADQWLALDGLVRGDEQSANDDAESTGIVARSDSNSRVFLFCVICRVEWGNNLQQQPQTADYDNTALMVTSDRMALVRGDPRWLTNHQVQFRTWGVSILSLQQLVNLVSLESFVSKPEQIRCYFLDEASGMEEKWTVSLATREAVDQLIEAVRYPWEAVFSVELEINELDE